MAHKLAVARCNVINTGDKLPHRMQPPSTTDKCMFRIQDAGMRIACPHCQAAYQIEALPSGAVLVCHRCGNKFSAQDEEEPALGSVQPDEQLPLFRGQRDSRAAPTISEHQKGDPSPASGPAASVATLVPSGSDAVFDGVNTVTYRAEPMPDEEAPQAKSTRIWPWLVSVLVIAIVAGFWLQKDDWLDNRWFRSTAVNLGIPIALRDKDWRVIPESVHAQWIIRDDQSKALLIEGRVENLLASDLPSPKIEVTFFTQDNPDQILLTRLMEITLPPTTTAVRHAPFIPPDRDIIPVSALGQRGFILLLQTLPEDTGDFALIARTGRQD